MRTLRDWPRRLQCSRNKACHSAALAESTNGVDATSLADGVGDGGHAGVEQAVLARGVVLAVPAPGVEEFFFLFIGTVTVLLRRLVAGDVGGEQPVRAGGVDEHGRDGDGGQGLDEELL